MRRLTAALAVCVGLAGGVKGADQEAGERLLFPRDSVRGYVDFQVAPRQSEIDLGLCTVKRDNPYPEFLGCNGYARYAWGGYVEVQPVGRGPLRRLFIFLEPTVYGGDNVPHYHYTASAALILWERSMGVGVDLPRGFQVRLKNHRTYTLGRYAEPGGATDLRSDGPYGLYTTVGVRWNFGGWGNSRR